MFDIVVGGLGWVLLLPVMGVIALLVWVTSGRPVLFRQLRVGRGGRDFWMLKFRTMTVRSGSEKGAFDAGSTSRVTPLGRILRRTKLDELPQLWNVVRGDMSLVGPRPEVRRWVEVYPHRWGRVLSVRPGITDPASVRFRNEEEILAASADPIRAYQETILPAKLDAYEAYVEKRSFRGDLRILAQTVVAVLLPSSASTSPNAGTHQGEGAP